MHLVARPIEAPDLVPCADLLAGRSAYRENLVSRLPDVWRHLLDEAAMIATVIEERLDEGTRILCFGASVFTTEAHAAEARRGREPYLSSRTLLAELTGPSPILRPRDAAAAGAEGGLNVLILHVGQTPGLDPERSRAVLFRLLRSFIEEHRGYRLRQLLQEIWDEVDPEFVLNGWGRVVTDYADHFSRKGEPLPAVGRRPHLLGLTAEEALANPGDPLAPAFMHAPPRCTFSPAEKALLRKALTGATDVELTAQLGLAPSTIKSRWRGIYARAARELPDVVRERTPPAGRDGRGREKRRRLLAYLRAHPEELRLIEIPDAEGGNANLRGG